MRSVTLWIITFLLFSPLIRSIEKREEKPMLVVGIDNSQSMNMANDANSKIRQLKTELAETCSEQYQIEYYTFGANSQQSDSVTFNEQRSDYADFIHRTNEKYYKRDVRAMILVGDGNSNSGVHPKYASANADYPIHTIGVGDSTVYEDQFIVDIEHNPNVFKGNQFVVNIGLQFEKFSGSQASFNIYQQGKKIETITLDIPQENHYINQHITLEANTPGLNKYEFEIQPTLFEKNINNNRKSIIVQVHDNKYKLLILSDGPHPDNGAITSALDKQANFIITTANVHDFEEQIKNYDAVVLNQLPSNNKQGQKLVHEIIQQEIPQLYIIGGKSSLSNLYNTNIGVEIPTTLETEESLPIFEENFSAFTLPTNLKRIQGSLPPLKVPFSSKGYHLSNDWIILATQRIKDIDTDYPLIAFTSDRQQKRGIIFGEGIWRWRLNEYQHYGESNISDMLITKMIEYLCIRENRDKLKIEFDPIVQETEQVKMTAKVFNDLYEPIVDGPVEIVITDTLNHESEYLFSMNASNYSLNMGSLPAGDYRFTASTTLDGEALTKEGAFSVNNQSLEQYRTRANFKLLHTISKNSGGEAKLWDEHHQIIEIINKHVEPSVVYTSRVNKGINLRILLLIIFATLALEWFFIKFWGEV